MSDYDAMEIISDNSQVIENLIKERDELKAHCERQHLALLNAIHSLPGGVTKADVRDVYDSVPHQSLAEHDYMVIDKAIDKLSKYIGYGATLSLQNYRDELIEQSKGGVK